jgi:hypothetical protein
MLPIPFDCDNCGYKPSPPEVLANKGTCPKCGDAIIAYTVDAAECIQQLSVLPDFTMETAMAIQTKHLKEWESVLKPEVFLLVRDKVAEQNVPTLTDPYMVCRGDDIAQIVHGIATSYNKSTLGVNKADDQL